MQRVKPDDQDADIANQLLHMVRIARKSAPGKDVIFEIQTDERRSNAQNDFMWPLIRQFAEFVGESSEEDMKNALLRQCFGSKTRTILGVETETFPKTSQFKKPQMSKFLDFIQQFGASEYGIRFMVPPGYEEWSR